MKKNSLFRLDYFFMIIALLGMTFMTSCGDDEPDPGGGVADALASFDFSVDGLDVTFTNASANAEGYTWDFGDGNTSTEEAPTHSYAAPGTYSVRLTATNSKGSDETSKDVTVTEKDVIKNFLVGKDWRVIRGEAIALGLGPQDDSWSWNSGVSPWFGWGDLEGAQALLATRQAATNDIYRFAADNSYTVDFAGDFWGEYGIWGGTADNETNIQIVNGTLPLNTNGDDVSAFVAGSWEYAIDEQAMTLAVIGDGAHILNPRYKNGGTSYDAGTGITYDIVHWSEGAEADTLVLKIDLMDNDFNSEPRTYYTFASYKGSVPDLKDPGATWVPTDFADEISAADIYHTLDSDAGFGPGVDEVTSSYGVEYGVEQDGATCTKLTKNDADGGFSDFKMWSRDADIRFDDNGTYTYSKAQVDVWIPSSNDYSGALQNLVEVVLADGSGMGDGSGGSPGFWNSWNVQAVADTPMDSWQTITIDFNPSLNDPDAQSGIRDNIDLVILRVGGSGHNDFGDFYVKNFKFIQ